MIVAGHDVPDPETVIVTVTDHAVETEGDQDHVTGGQGQGHGTEIGTGTERGAEAGPGTETGTERGAEADPGIGTGRGIRGVALIRLPKSSSLLILQNPKNQCL